jgi:hypothetical protein
MHCGPLRKSRFAETLYHNGPVLLQEINAQEAQTRTGGKLQQSTVLDAAARQLAGCDHEAILTQWSELFRTGLLAWGMNFSNPNPPFFHLTARGRQALENATLDSSNPAGYLRHWARGFTGRRAQRDSCG